jgi:hypothetical protein
MFIKKEGAYDAILPNATPKKIYINPVMLGLQDTCTLTYQQRPFLRSRL